MGGDARARPTDGAVNSPFDIVGVRLRRRAFIEHHDDVGAEIAFDFDHAFRRKKVS